MVLVLTFLFPGFVTACLRFLLLCLYDACMSVVFDGCVSTVIFLVLALRLPFDQTHGDGGGLVECPYLVYVRWRCFAIFMGSRAFMWGSLGHAWPCFFVGCVFVLFCWGCVGVVGCVMTVSKILFVGATVRSSFKWLPLCFFVYVESFDRV